LKTVKAEAIAIMSKEDTELRADNEEIEEEALNG
jgi:hypothetical protein